jgi:hypothetical protein
MKSNTSEHGKPTEVTHTYSMPKYSAYKIFSTSNRVNFDQMYNKQYQHLESQINTIGIIIKYILIWYRFAIVDIYI